MHAQLRARPGACSGGRSLTPGGPKQEAVTSETHKCHRRLCHNKLVVVEPVWGRRGARVVHVWCTCTVPTAQWCKLHTPKPLASQELLYLNVFYVLCKLFMWEGK